MSQPAAQETRRYPAEILPGRGPRPKLTCPPRLPTAWTACDGEREYYDIEKDPFERDNIYGRLSATTKARLHASLAPLTRCHGSGTSSCWRAERPQPITP